MHRTDMPPVIHAVLAHAQFESLHPFVDGNGRTGRAIVQAMTRRADVTRHVTAPVSAGLLRDTQGYFDELTRYRAGDAAPIIDVFMKSTIFAASGGSELVENLVAEKNRMVEAANVRS